MHCVKYIRKYNAVVYVCKKLTSWRILKNSSVIIVSGYNFKFSFSNRFSNGAACDYFNFTGIVLASFWNIKMVHSIVSKFVSWSTDNSMSVNKPHNAWTWMTSYPATESCPFSFFDGNRFGFADEGRSLPWFTFFDCFFRNTKMYYMYYTNIYTNIR